LPSSDVNNACFGRQKKAPDEIALKCAHDRAQAHPNCPRRCHAIRGRLP
jgi:hypothetical protein